MADTDEARLPCIVLFNINGSGMGHLSTCLAYANRLRGRARPVFFSLASAIEFIEEMGFEADYFVSRFWSRASSWAWDRQLALRLGLLFERVRPEVVVFDGTWPYRGLLEAATIYGVPRLVWSDLTLYKRGTRNVPVRDDDFDLHIRLGEPGSTFSVDCEEVPGRRVTIPPFTMLEDRELLSREEARDALGLDRQGRYALFSLGPGNLKDVSGIGRGLIDEMRAHGHVVVWARAPISVQDVPLPDDVIPVTAFPLVRFMRAFDVYVGAAGYNSCCEILQSGLPSLFVPNAMVSDDQQQRAEIIARLAPAVVSSCDTPEQRTRAVKSLMTLCERPGARLPRIDLSGAGHAANEILALIDRQQQRSRLLAPG